jgi:hypothetical protein
MWEYTGLGELSDDELMLTRATYDATLLELDELLGNLLRHCARRATSTTRS